MTTIAVTFDTQAVSKDDFDKVAQGGTVLGAAGLLNLRWEEFSALDAARELDLHGVVWEAARDDTPGSLTCVIRYDTFTLPELQERLLDPTVIEYEIREGGPLPSVAYGDRGAPYDGD